MMLKCNDDICKKLTKLSCSIDGQTLPARNMLSVKSVCYLEVITLNIQPYNLTRARRPVMVPSSPWARYEGPPPPPLGIFEDSDF